MKTLGIIGGLSWVSTAHYYQQVHERVRDRLGGLHAPRVLLDSLPFHEVEALQRAGDWDLLAPMLADSAATLEAAGADLLILATNTMHKLASAIEDRVSIPFLHIADPTAETIKAAGISRIALLGTRFTMGEDFYVDRLQRHGLEVMTPDADGQREVDRVIFDELVLDRASDESRGRYRSIIQEMVDRGAEGLILGCTEIGLLIGPEHCSVPVFDTTKLHALAAADAVMASADEELAPESTHGAAV
jgi:amino-acid racemase